jgi:hypothetical protein
MGAPRGIDICIIDRDKRHTVPNATPTDTVTLVIDLRSVSEATLSKR